MEDFILDQIDAYDKSILDEADAGSEIDDEDGSILDEEHSSIPREHEILDDDGYDIVFDHDDDDLHEISLENRDIVYTDEDGEQSMLDGENDSTHRAVSSYQAPDSSIHVPTAICNEASPRQLSGTCSATSLAGSVLVQVENVFEGIVDSLNNETKISIMIRRRTSILSTANSKCRNTAHQRISFPGKTPEEAWRFSTGALISQPSTKWTNKGQLC